LATFVRLPSGSWRAVVRRKSKYVSRTFHRKDDARAWAIEAERDIDKGNAPTPARVKRLQTFGGLIDLHVSDMKEVGKAPGRSKSATLDMLKRELGALKMTELDRERLVRQRPRLAVGSRRLLAAFFLALGLRAPPSARSGAASAQLRSPRTGAAR
jgi:hypothetical protein